MSFNFTIKLITLATLIQTLSIIELAQAQNLVNTSSLATARFGHTASLLQNGLVLVAGGLRARINLYFALAPRAQ